MKKQIAFYIGWDLTFAMFLYIYSRAEVWTRMYTQRTFDFSPIIFVPYWLMILAGGLIFGLALVTGKIQFTRRLAVIEFIIIGIPSFYLATIITIPYFVASVIVHGNVQYYMPQWLIQSSTPMIFGSIIFGYEMFAFIFRVKVASHYKNGNS